MRCFYKKGTAMSAPRIQADYDSLSTIAKHFAAKAQDTHNLICVVQRCVDDLQRGGWIGKGADRFYAEMQNVVSPAMQRLRNALDDASSATTRIAQTLAQHEREAGMLFAGDVAVAGGGAVGVGVGGGILGGAAQFLRDLFQGGRDPRNGFIKSLNTIVGSGLGELAGEASKNFIKHGSKAFKNVMGAVGGGVASGVVDLAFAYLNGSKIDGDVIFDQLASGVVQGLIGLNPAGRAVLLADAGIQIVGQALAQGAANNAEWLAYGDLARAESIRQTAGRLSAALDNLSLDGRIDGIVGAIRSGVQQGDITVAASGVAKEIGRFALGLVSAPAEGAMLALHTSAGMAKRAADVLGNIADNVDRFVSGFSKILW
ncbi:MAG: hypothetical protein CUN49_11590 [Candidatus Thermofonsia Clade 1 bacterium]|uniref:WXG100 family type VII secretion target n=1 Tax=Candidatus Thermofonsia Clade 1 bacterium TaxID=2364210 RepID=A0A2M8PCF2_9CHLR|nr:MAG: hypothetical protein CUN49_11590 [Candidatus Thermofonsia Clade 1 bacterium]PJF42827.1 MAG: hypothetical protein CUN50_02760 [Candidatus Thermofonsia Clade 1 bacterium]